MHLIQKPANAECLHVDSGIKAFRTVLDNDNTLSLEVSSTELLWLIARKGDLEVHAPMHDDWRGLNTGHSSMFFYNREPWQLQLRGESKTHAMGFGISLTTLHQLLAVEYDGMKSKQSDNVDYPRLMQVITLSPRHLQELDRIFIQSHETRFGNIARRGAFLSALATLLETLFGHPLSHCPYHIDLETEQKIRRAQEILVSDLHEMRDIPELARETNLPKTVLKEGFEYLYGKPAAQYYQDYRFEKSLAMLESGKYLIRDIAFAVGFQNPSHFITAFKQRYQTTPKQWIKQQQRAVLPEFV
ncbi:MAG TPA: AraC family transcriptional regulator [Saprospiraceae bacterium]|nr:AraC family transcriptional regulator [Saprospiraceae bacterium]